MKKSKLKLIGIPVIVGTVALLFGSKKLIDKRYDKYVSTFISEDELFKLEVKSNVKGLTAKLIFANPVDGDYVVELKGNLKAEDSDTIWFENEDKSIKLSLSNNDSEFYTSRIYEGNKDVEDSTFVKWVRI